MRACGANLYLARACGATISRGILHESQISRFVQKILGSFRAKFCTFCDFRIFCRRFSRFWVGFSARKRILRFFAEKTCARRRKILHKLRILHFVQKRARFSLKKVCTNCRFAIFCRIPPDFGRKKSAQNQFFEIRAETCPILGEKIPHELRFCVFVRKSVHISVKIGLAGAGIIPMRACGNLPFLSFYISIFIKALAEGHLGYCYRDKH